MELRSAQLKFGTPPDTNLYRSAAGTLTTDGHFFTGGQIKATGQIISMNALAQQIALSADGKLYFGSAADTNLYRSAAGVLKTDGQFAVQGITIDPSLPGITGPGNLDWRSQGDVYVSAQTSTGQVVLRNLTNFRQVAFNPSLPGAGFTFDSDSAANLYRSGAGVLKTDGVLNVSQLQGMGDVYSQYGIATQVRIGNNSGRAAVDFGSAFDTSLARLSAGVLGINGVAIATGGGAGGGTSLPGSPTNGQVFLLRLGSSPYTFLQMTYDSTLGKWISADEWQQPNAAFNSQRTLSDYGTTPTEFNAADRAIWQPWKPMIDLGLIPQFRLQGTLGQVAGGAVVTFSSLGFLGENVGAAATVFDAALVHNASTAVTIASGLFVFTDSGWISVTGLASVDRMACGVMGYRTTGGSLRDGGAKHVKIGLRWISP